MSAPYIVRAVDPAGAVSFLCHEAPGLTPDAAKALRFVSLQVATRAARAARWGDPNAFWNSERASAAATAKARAGWTFTAEPAP